MTRYTFWKRGFSLFLLCIGILILTGDKLADFIIFQYWRTKSPPYSTGILYKTNQHYIKIGHDSIHVLTNTIENPKGTIIYFHGNKGGLDRWNPIAAELCKFQYNVITWDYKGYGKSSGKSSLDNFLSDGSQIFNQVIKLDTTRRIILFGRSLGTGLACALAGNPHVEKIILETPYTSMKQLVAFHTFLGHHLLSGDIPSLNLAGKVQKPILVIHGTSDKVIPYSMGKTFFEGLKSEQKQWLSITGGSHDNLNSFSDYWNILEQFLDVKQ